MFQKMGNIKFPYGNNCTHQRFIFQKTLLLPTTNIGCWNINIVQDFTVEFHGIAAQKYHNLYLIFLKWLKSKKIVLSEFPVT